MLIKEKIFVILLLYNITDEVFFAKTVQDILNIIKENDIKMVDFKMVDINGQYRHVTIPAENFSEDTMKSGIGFDAPVTVGYATSNRSAVIRIPAYAKSPDKRRFGLRNHDATCNPYFCYAAILMAGLDGIKNFIKTKRAECRQLAAIPNPAEFDKYYNI